MNYIINTGGILMDLSTPKVMGIVNITPDSFYSGSRSVDETTVAVRVGRMLMDGADMIDVGACSTRPGSSQVDGSEEMSRLRMGLGVIRKHHPDVLLSVDTYRASVAKMCVEEYGVNIVNDISGGMSDSEMFRTVATLGVPYVLSHIQGSPSDMTSHTQYVNLMDDILYYFSERVQMLRDLGQKDIIIDPGFGFSKTLDQNYELLSHLDELEILNLPILAGVSRKSMIYKLFDTDSDSALTGTIALNMACLERGVSILRVHDVKECNQVVQLYEQIKKHTT